jgi:hypothetical protein
MEKRDPREECNTEGTEGPQRKRRIGSRGRAWEVESGLGTNGFVGIRRER